MLWYQFWLAFSPYGQADGQHGMEARLVGCYTFPVYGVLLFSGYLESLVFGNDWD